MVFVGFSLQDSQIANPGVHMPVNYSLLLFEEARTLPSGQVARPSKQQAPFLIHAAATFDASPFLALPHKVTSLVIVLVVSPAPT